jgi:uncharacterized protein (UPF0303 family)
MLTPREQLEVVRESWDNFVLESFTIDDAFELGHLLYARLLPFAAQKPTLISIALANSAQVVFQTTVGSGVVPDNSSWVARKRAAALRFNSSSWALHCKFDGDDRKFADTFCLGPEQAEAYSIHGGAVPIRVRGVEGIVAVVVVSGLKQEQDHGVICDVIRSNWQ